MQIVARAEPRYYIELTEADATLIHDVVLKLAFRSPEKYHKAAELTAGWRQYLDIRKNYRETCEAAGYTVQTSQTVNATHAQLEVVNQALSKAGPMDLERAERLTAIRSLFTEMMESASRQFRQHEMSMVSVDLMEPV